MSAPNILERILAQKRLEVAALPPMAWWQEQIKPLPAPLPFAEILRQDLAQKGFAVIAEIKKASPSQGVIRENFDAVAIAQDYAAHGASALSVLTDELFFQGSLGVLQQVRQAVALPLLRKDFMIDPRQIMQARVFGADAILLIVAALDDATLASLAECAVALGLTVLIEVHDAAELSRALMLPLHPHLLIGVNNRNLKTFAVSLDTIIALKPSIPAAQIGICESGIHSAADVRRMSEHGIQAFLIGEAFMRAASPGLALQQLFSQD